jgi:LysM repeat protein
MTAHTQRNTAAALLLAAAIVLAACTRSASTGTVPTATAGAQTAPDVSPGGAEPTDAMNALGTALAAQITQTAQAAGQAGGQTPVAPGEVQPTPIPPTTQAPPPGATTPAPAGTTACPNPYTVKQGEWIYKIARDCKVEPSAIIAANPGINPNVIKPGQQLNMPAAGATAVPPATSQAQACSGSYTVKSGDNLFRIAYNCGLTTEQLAAVNGVRFPYTIYPGQVLRFP